MAIATRPPVPEVPSPEPSRTPRRLPAPATPPAGGTGTARRRSVRDLGPNWYATAMGTAITATAGAGLTPGATALRPLWTGLWALSLAALTAVLIARAAHWSRHREHALRSLDDPATAPFHGCLAMALLAVGGGALALGRPGPGASVAVGLGLVLAGAGAVVALVVAVVVPYRLLTARRRGRARGRITPVWLLAVVPLVVAAATGPLCLPWLPPATRGPVLYGCLAALVAGLLGALVLLVPVCAGLLADGPPPPALTPALFLVLGPLGQSTTALDRIAAAAPGTVPPGLADGLGAAVVPYGVPVLGFGCLWLALSVGLVVRARRRGLRFAMTWWAFTFPLGTCVTGAAALAGRTGWAVHDALAAVLYAGLAAVWTVVAARTALDLARGRLPAPTPGPRLPTASTAR
ncbi:SLAC1 family transporter [Streptomyces sp. JNUCC 64]